jgi:hypothetical protein
MHGQPHIRILDLMGLNVTVFAQSQLFSTIRQLELWLEAGSDKRYWSDIN